MKLGLTQESVCKKCDKTITEKEGMSNHLKSHKRAEKVLIKCDHCNFETSDGDILLKHISETHIKFHTCLTCKMAFLNKDDLIAHAVKNHTLVKSNIDTSKCAACAEEFIAVEQLIRVHRLVNEDTLLATEAGQQLEKVWPNESTANFKCYDCGQGVNERGDLIKHNRENHYKKKNCKSFHENHYCRFSAIERIYVHRPEERQWQSRGQQGGLAVQQGDLQSNMQSWGPAVCKNGTRCSWLANNRCKFRYEDINVPSAAQNQNGNNVNNVNANNVTIPSTPSPTGNNTVEACMKAIMERLEQLESRMPVVRNLSGFPPLVGEKKSQ